MSRAIDRNIQLELFEHSAGCTITITAGAGGNSFDNGHTGMVQDFHHLDEGGLELTEHGTWNMEGY